MAEMADNFDDDHRCIVSRHNARSPARMDLLVLRIPQMLDVYLTTEVMQQNTGAAGPGNLFSLLQGPVITPACTS